MRKSGGSVLSLGRAQSVLEWGAAAKAASMPWGFCGVPGLRSSRSSQVTFLLRWGLAQACVPETPLRTRSHPVPAQQLVLAVPGASPGLPWLLALAALHQSRATLETAPAPEAASSPAGLSQEPARSGCAGRRASRPTAPGTSLALLCPSQTGPSPASSAWSVQKVLPVFILPRKRK